MSANVVASTLNFTNVKFGAPREFAKFPPCVWGDYFLTQVFEQIDPKLEQQHGELKEEVRKMLMETEDGSFHKMQLIDSIQRFGVDYHFKNELEDAIEKLSQKSNDEDDLYTTALWFRLLRQQRIRASCDVFEKFKNEEGKFKASLEDDVEGMLSLYEAAHLGTHGEDILDQALEFTTEKLQLISTRVAPHIAQDISFALNRPIRKNFVRLEARHYITSYQNKKSHNKSLLMFAKIDFMILQRLHQEELKDLTLWWKKWDVPTRLPYARSRVVELYFEANGTYFEPHYSLARKILTKCACIVSLLDDTHDNYGTPEELDLFIQIIQRWDISGIDKLPEYMKTVFRVILDVYDEIEKELTKGGCSYALPFAKQALKTAGIDYHNESKWRTTGHMPTVEEYMPLAMASTAYNVLHLCSFLGMGKIATKEAYEWIAKGPKIATANATICRLMDDLVSNEFEQKRQHIPSAIECYKEQYGTSEDEAVKLIRKKISDSWKDINGEMLKPIPVPKEVVERVFTYIRLMDVLYKDGDGYTNPHLMKDVIASVFIDSVMDL